ncbi:MAG: glutathione S-transferase [Arenimonas sp.]|nr:glutathione S-transferase [Arenimonas sp.]
MIKLYQFQLSGNSHKVRLMLSLLSLPYEAYDVSGASREQKSPEFLALNPFGQVPVLVHGDIVVRDSQAILAYLGKTFGNGHWWPENASDLAQVVAWLSTAANEVAYGPNLLRLHHRFGREINLPAAEAVTTQLMQALEVELTNKDWLLAFSPTVADVAMYPYIALAPDAKIDLSPYPAIRAWLARMQALPGYISMPGMWVSGQSSD